MMTTVIKFADVGFGLDWRCFGSKEWRL